MCSAVDHTGTDQDLSSVSSLQDLDHQAGIGDLSDVCKPLNLRTLTISTKNGQVLCCHKVIWHMYAVDERLRQHGKRCLKISRLRLKRPRKCFRLRRNELNSRIFCRRKKVRSSETDACAAASRTYVASGGWSAARNSDEKCAPALRNFTLTFLISTIFNFASCVHWFLHIYVLPRNGR